MADEVIKFRPPSVDSETDAERAGRLTSEVERLARLPLVEWMFYVDEVAKKHGIAPAKLKQMVEAVIKANEKKAREDKAEDRQREQRVEKKQATERREQQRASERQQRQQEREQARADREARERQRERDRELVEISKLPRAEHELRLVALAERLGEDPEVLRDEFAQFVSTEEEASVAAGEVEPWPEPVDTKTLLDDVLVQLRRYAAIHDDASAIMHTVAVPFAWCHDDLATYSPILAVQGADVDSAKTTLCQLLALLTPRSHMIVKPTGPSLYRLIDHKRPTLFIDNGDKLLARDRDLTDIVDSSWTRGIRIPRVVDGHIYEFDPFCFKIINGVDLLPHLGAATRSRCIVTEMWPKLPDEKVVEFKHAKDDERFTVLRRKLTRWFADNKAAIESAVPIMPEGFNNRLKENYVLFFAIADLAGGDWSKKVRAAAVKLTREYNVPSLGRRLLAVFHVLFSRCGKLLTSKQVEDALPAYGDEWASYRNRGRPINRWEIAQLLRPYKIIPGVIHPRGRPADRGYDATWFETAFKHFLGQELGKTSPRGRTVVRRRRRQRKHK
jgi:hypothetical protein